MTMMLSADMGEPSAFGSRRSVTELSAYNSAVEIGANLGEMGTHPGTRKGEALRGTMLSCQRTTACFYSHFGRDVARPLTSR